MKKPKRKSQNRGISKKMTFAQILNKNQDIALLLMEKGLHCVGCGASAYETIEQSAIMHGLDPDKLVNDINNKFYKLETKNKRRKKK